MGRLAAVIAFVGLFSAIHAVEWDVFSTKTSYFWTHNATSSVPDNMSRFMMGQTTCDAVSVYMVARHGARNPTKHSIQDIKAIGEKLINHKASDKFPFLDHWTSRYDLATEGELVPFGAEEEEFVGSRLGEAFRSIFSTQNQNEATYEIITSYKQRTIDSARSFYTGFSQKTGSTHPFTSQVNNSLTRFYSGCVRYEAMVSDNATNFKQFDDFSNTPEFQGVANAVKQRLGLNMTLTPDDVYTMYDLCAYETYIFNDTTWCSLMTDAERRVLEYGMDVQNYYESMYGNPLNEEVACPLARDLFLTLDDVVRAVNASHGRQQASYDAGKFIFGHSETMAKLLASLGLFRDSPGPSASNMAAMSHRKFRSSLVLPYSANMVFVLYQCGPSNGQTREIKVKLFVNEEAVRMPACGNEFVCDYTALRKAYSGLVDNCDEKRFCELRTGAIVG